VSRVSWRRWGPGRWKVHGECRFLAHSFLREQSFCPSIAHSSCLLSKGNRDFLIGCCDKVATADCEIGPTMKNVSESTQASISQHSRLNHRHITALLLQNIEYGTKYGRNMSALWCLSSSPEVRTMEFV